MLGLPQLDLESKRRITKPISFLIHLAGHLCRLALPYSVGYSTLVIVLESVTVCSTVVLVASSPVATQLTTRGIYRPVVLAHAHARFRPQFATLLYPAITQFSNFS